MKGAAQAEAVAPAAPAVLAAREARALAALMTSLQGNLLGIALGNAVVAGALVIGLWSQVDAPTGAPVLLGWLALQLLHSGFSLWAWWRVRGRPASVRAAPRRARASVWASAGSGLLWAAALPLFWPSGRMDLQLLLITLVSGLCSGAIHSLSGHPRAVLAFLLPNVAAVAGLCLWQGGTLHAAIAVAAVIYGITGARFARAMHEVQRRSLLQREELADLAADLAAQKERAEQASQAKSRFLAAASHDIRQPVHALGLFLGAFDEAALSGRNATLIGPLRDSARGLREMLDGVLDLSRAEAGTLTATPVPVAVQALLDLAEREFAPLAEAKGLVLRCVPCAAHVRADPLLLERILRNLVANAVRYTARGGVLVGARRRGGQVVLEVWDTGPGIAPEAQEAVFAEFSRGPGAASAEPGGLGLGLAIARRFAAVQGAALGVASRPGRGSVFRLALPPAEAPAVEATVPAAADLRGLRVLLVDDDAAVRTATGLLLRDWGIEVEVLADPDALAGSASAAVPDVVVTDNDFGGHERAHDVAAWLAARTAPALPLVVATGARHAANLDALQGQGAIVLAKPVDPAALRQALAVQSRRAPRSLRPAFSTSPSSPASHSA